MNNRMLKIIAVSVRVCGLFSIVLGLIWVVGSSITIVPDWEETLQDILRSVAISFVVFISLASIFLGIERSFRHKIVASKKRRIVSRFLVLFLILTGAELLTFGHAYYIKSQKRESEKIEILNKYKYRKVSGFSFALKTEKPAGTFSRNGGICFILKTPTINLDVQEYVLLFRGGCAYNKCEPDEPYPGDRLR